MSANSSSDSKPLNIAIGQFTKAIFALCAFSFAGGGVIEILGSPKDIGPRVEVSVPDNNSNNNANSPNTSLPNTRQNPNGFIQAIAWSISDLGILPLTKWLKLESYQAFTADGKPVNGVNPNDKDYHQATNSKSPAPATNQANSTTQKTALIDAPIAGLHQGNLPIIAADGRTVFSEYKRPFAATGAPKIAIVLGGLGLNAPISERAINQLPPEVTLSFVASAPNLQLWINKARAKGHEVLIEIPMEPFDYPKNDPGPQTILTDLPIAENQRRLETSLSSAMGYFGVTNYLGAKLATSDNMSTSVMQFLKARGIGFISDGTAKNLGQTASKVGVKTASANLIIDKKPSDGDIKSQLGALEATAGQKGQAIGFGSAYSITIDEIDDWVLGLKLRGITLAPVSALAN